MLDRMKRALHLTREGRMHDATAVIQDAIGRSDAPGDAASRRTAKSRRAGPATPGGDAASASRTAESPRSGTLGFDPKQLTGRLPRPNLKLHPAVRGRVKRGGISPAVPDGSRWEWHTHAGPHGSRRYRLFVPSAGDAAKPLVVMLHGCTQDPDDFAAGTRILEAAAERGLIVVLPEQTRQANPMACWNWFEPAHQARGGEPGILAGIVGDVAAGEGVDRARIVVAGLSAGGAMALVLGESYPDLFRGVGVHSGLPTGVARDTGSALAAMRNGPAVPSRGRGGAARLFVLHGDADTTVSPRNADALLEQARSGAMAETVEPKGAATITRLHRPDGTAMAEFWRVPGLGHAWSGGAPGASYTAPNAPEATGPMLDFLLAD